MVKGKKFNWQLEYVEFPTDMRDRVDIPKYQREVNFLDLSGFSPLHWAIIKNSLQRVISLIEFGADVNLKDINNISPLEHALKIPESQDIISILIENGALITKDTPINSLPDRKAFIQQNDEKLREEIKNIVNNPVKSFHVSFRYSKAFELLPQAEFLEEISLNFNNLSCIPFEITRLINLRKLDLSNNLITEIPQEIQLLKNLRFICLSHNYIRDCTNLSGFELLNELVVSSNQIRAIPKEISQLKRLFKIDFSYNFISFITPALMDLNLLEIIDFSHNDISILDIDIHNLPSLNYLNISHNKLIKLQFDEIIQSPNIKTFKFSHNSFPREINRILECHYQKNLFLDLSGLGITAIRKEALLLQNLRELSLRNNNLTIVPEEIGQLVNLQILDLSYNRIRDLPLFIYRLSQLQELKLEETKNYITNPPRSVIDRGLKCIMGYYADLLKELDPCFRMKLMLVGQGYFIPHFQIPILLLILIH